MACTYDDLSNRSEIQPVDVAFAEMINRRFGQSNAEVSMCLAWMMSQIRQGHTCVNIADLPYPDALPKAWISNKEANKLLIREDNRLYFHRYWHMETRLIKPLYARLNQLPDESIECPAEFLEGLNKEQAMAVQGSLKYSFFILAGGPGTGKTYTAARIVAAHGAKRIALVAPTGKAVARLKQHICSAIDPDRVEAKTLHALLGIKKPRDLISLPHVLSYDLIVIDESSMMDLSMWGLLLNSCLGTTKIIVIGDPNQLPPIEVGNVFEELCSLKPQNMVELKQCMRTDRLELLNLAQMVCEGKISESFSFEEQMPGIDDLTDRIPKEFNGARPCKATDYFSALKKFQILSGLRQGPYGVDKLNQAIWDSIKNRTKSGCVALPIIVTRNAFDLGLSNGDIGVWIRDLDRPNRGDVFFQIGDAVRSISCALIPSFEMAYVISVHKSQGSEYDDVLLLLPPGCEKFGRKMLYTAITRARRSLTIVSSSDTLRACIDINPIRKSGLLGRLKCIDSSG